MVKNLLDITETLSNSLNQAELMIIFRSLNDWNNLDLQRFASTFKAIYLPDNDHHCEDKQSLSRKIKKIQTFQLLFIRLLHRNINYTVFQLDCITFPISGHIRAESSLHIKILNIIYVKQSKTRILHASLVSNGCWKFILLTAGAQLR